MKKSFLPALLLFCFSHVFAQNELMVQSSEKGLYLNHTVAAKENFYSIGRLFNIPPKEIATFNDLDMNHGLSIGQTLKIPLNASNFTQTTGSGRAVYYVVGPKEGLYRVSLKNNNVLMANLRKWNRLTNDNITTGQKLVIGYLMSPEAGNITQSDTDKKQTMPEEKKDAVEIPKKDPPVEKKENPVEKTEEKKPEVKKVDEKRPDAGISKTQDPAPRDLSVSGSGYFKSHFDLQIKSQPAKNDQTASAGIFKTASGWKDAKYYALMDRVEPGTIIKITNPTNNKVIYAKVLGEMSGIRQNQGYDIRISNAGASALDVSDAEKFIVRVNY